VRKFVLLGAYRSDEGGAADDENASLRFSLGNVPTAADGVADVSGAQACETAGLVP
jgi:hypothetical protein